ncbi:MAG: AAA family ATPase [Gammaproteobacteria bacterium]|nr:AAA family ATPase [Gammaproteobacteria bacterium]
MRLITIMNPKGGCGKTTVATNMAAAFASEGANVTMVDFDPQGSTIHWLARRPEGEPAITGINAAKRGIKSLSDSAVKDADFVIMDAPAAIRGNALIDLLNHSETVVIPVLPSPIDIDAAAQFIEQLRRYQRVKTGHTKLAVIANRAKTNTLMFDQLEQFLEKTRVPYLTALRDAQNYNRAYTRGLGVYELPEYLAWPDWEQWTPILDWIDSRKSQAA